MTLFGTDGIRGRAGTPPITAIMGVAVGRAAARLADGEPVVVARDTRASGPMLEAAVVAGAASLGVEARVAGVLPTSGLTAALRAGLGGAGVMLTASHNPDRDNGFKLLGRGGEKLDDATAGRVEAWLAEPGQGGPVGAVRSVGPLCAQVYGEALQAALYDLAPLRDLRIAVDLANGAATAAVPILESLGLHLVLTGDRHGPVNDGCGSESLGHLGKVVRRRRCAAGIAVDGDADRCRLVDHTGHPVPGDAVAWLFARGLELPRLAVTVMSSGALEASLPNVDILRTPVGDRHLLAALRSDPSVRVGSEESGHVVFADGLPTGDGLLTGLRALVLAFSRAPTLQEAVASFPRFPRALTKVPVRSRLPLDDIPTLTQARDAGAAHLGDGGRVFLRYSGTEDVLRVLVEGVDADAVQTVSAEVTRIAAEELS